MSSVGKLITDYLPHICILLCFHINVLGRIYQHPRINGIAPSDQFQRIRNSAELNDLKSFRLK